MENKTFKEILKVYGTCMHGLRWQSAIARDLGVSKVTIWRWLKGYGEPRDKDNIISRLNVLKIAHFKRSEK